MKGAVALVALLVAGCGSAPAATTRTDYVPWRPLPAQHQYMDAPLASPVPPIPVPAGTPACQASQLEGVNLGSSGATGNVNMPLLLRNRGSAACYLEGYPDATVIAPSGKVLASGSGATGRGTYFNDGPVVQVVLKPGLPPLPTAGPGYTPPLGEAFMNFSWYDCQPLQANRLALDLPDGGGRLVMPFDMQAYYSAGCDASNALQTSVFRGPFSPTGTEWPPGPDYFNVEITVSTPRSVRRGSTLIYLVTITNRDGRSYELAPCPDYLELLNQKDPVGDYQLNCPPAAVIATGDHMTFEMHMDVPADASSGPNTLRWALQDGRIGNPFAQVPIEID